MDGQHHNFNAEMRNATDPDHPPGGSRAVRGKLLGTAVSATVQATGFMMSDNTISTNVPAQDQSSNPPPLQPRAAWMREGDDRTDDQADADWHTEVHWLPRAPWMLEEDDQAEASQSASVEAPPPRLSFFDEEYVAGRRVPSPTATTTEPDPMPTGPERPKFMPLAKGRGCATIFSALSLLANSCRNSLQTGSPSTTTTHCQRSNACDKFTARWD
jgi:hypothetical protein